MLKRNVKTQHRQLKWKRKRWRMLENLAERTSLVKMMLWLIQNQSSMQCQLKKGVGCRLGKPHLSQLQRRTSLRPLELMASGSCEDYFVLHVNITHRCCFPDGHD